MATEQEFFDEIRMTLGGQCLVDVELTDDDYRLCFKKAVRIFKQQGHNNYRRHFAAIDVVRDETVYTLPSNTYEVMRVITPSTGFSGSDDITNSLIYDSLFRDVLSSGTCGCGGGQTGFDLLSYHLTMQRMENLQRYSARDVDFEYDKFTNELTIIGTPKTEGKFFVDLYLNLEDEEYREIDWIVRWSVAEAKEILGRAYRKFPSLPGPLGETNLSGAELVQEGKDEKTELKQEILEFVDGDTDWMMITMG